MLNVMVLDDDATVRRSLMMLIDWESLNANFVCAVRDGAEALKILEHERIDLIISDIKMPVMNGIEFLKHVRSFNNHVEVIVISAYEDFGYARDAIQYGVRQYLIKPMTNAKIKQLSETIADIAREMEYEENISALLHDEEFREHIRQMLAKKYVEAEVFELDFSRIKRHSDVFRRYYWILLDILFEYLEEIGVRHVFRDNTYKQFVSLDTVEKCKEFTIEKYGNIFQFESKNKKNAVLFESVKNFIETEYRDVALDRNYIADRFDVSNRYLAKIFHKRMDMGIAEYIIKIRMEKSAALLTKTNQPINVIAKNVGYLDEKYFMRQFKGYFGSTPTEYRVEHKETEL